jgi:ribosomal protein L12E/L44/L45/RPP1/RPP2
MSEVEKSQTAVNLAILVLYDSKLEITAENINKVLNAVGIKVESYWADIYCEALKG